MPHKKLHPAKRRSPVSPSLPGDNNVWAFKGQNCDLPSFVEGLFIHCHADRGALSLYVDIPRPMVFQKSIKKAAPIIQAWSARLRQWQKQGPWSSVGEHRFYIDLAQRNSRGVGYGTLAAELNEAVAKELEEWFRDDKMTEQVVARQDITPAKQWEKLLQLSKKSRYSFRTGLSHAQMILRIMGIPDRPSARSEDTISTWCEEALQNLRKGRPAFTKGRAPITTARVARYFRTYRDRSKTS